MYRERGVWVEGLTTAHWEPTHWMSLPPPPNEPSGAISPPLFVLEQRFKPGWYLEWLGDECGGPYWTNDLAKAERFTLDRAGNEKGMLREETLIREVVHANIP
jgi:hypothetical protein